MFLYEVSTPSFVIVLSMMCAIVWMCFKELVGVLYAVRVSNGY